MLKVIQPARMINSMGTTHINEMDFENGDNWDVEDGSLTVYDEDGVGIVQFAPGHWSYVILVD